MRGRPPCAKKENHIHSPTKKPVPQPIRRQLQQQERRRERKKNVIIETQSHLPPSPFALKWLTRKNYSLAAQGLSRSLADPQRSLTSPNLLPTSTLPPWPNPLHRTEGKGESVK